MAETKAATTEIWGYVEEVGLSCTDGSVSLCALRDAVGVKLANKSVGSGVERLLPANHLF